MPSVDDNNCTSYLSQSAINILPAVYGFINTLHHAASYFICIKWSEISTQVSVYITHTNTCVNGYYISQTGP